MGGAKLHEFDLALCNYVRGNLRQYGDVLMARRRGRRLIAPPALHDFIFGAPEQEWLLLNDNELNQIIIAFEDLPIKKFEWSPYEALHRRYIQTVKEVRDELSKQVAEDWSEECVRFQKRLEGEPLSLAKGIEIVQEWLQSLRSLLQSIEAIDFLPCPEGRSPTPTCPTPFPRAEASGSRPSPTASEDRDEADLKRLRQSIQESARGMQAPVKEIIKKTGIGNSRGRELLRRLERRGEYNGFSRNKPPRYQQDRQNDQ